MWLLPVFGLLCRVICAIFYRLRVAGDRPGSGAVLLVANHPNALLDPVIVAVAAGRAVRFLAKAPLFTQAGIGWLVRGVGSIPVYRPSDFPGESRSNNEMFQAAFDALASGSAIGLFPEGTSHSDPELKPLKTGAARIALGCFRTTNCRPRIVPVGLVLRAKQTFRSEALAVLGEPVAWDDLESDEDPERVRELTRRIDDALRRVTVNLDAWEDGPLVETAEAIYRAEVLESVAADRQPSDPDAPDDSPHLDRQRIERLAVATKILSERRQHPEALEDPDLVPDLLRYEQELRSLRMTPRDVAVSRTLARSLRWVAGRLYLFGLPSILTAVVGYWLFWLPYRLTGILSQRLAPSIDQLATYKVLAGALCYGTWVVSLSILGAVGAGSLWPVLDVWWARVFTFGLFLVLLPLVGMAGLAVRERWRSSSGDLRRHFRLRRRQGVAMRLRRVQSELAERIDVVVRAYLASH